MGTSAETRRRNRRLELRALEKERALIARAAEVSGSDLTGFVIFRASEAARRVLAGRERVELDAEAAASMSTRCRR